MWNKRAFIRFCIYRALVGVVVVAHVTHLHCYICTTSIPILSSMYQIKLRLRLTRQPPSDIIYFAMETIHTNDERIISYTVVVAV